MRALHIHTPSHAPIDMGPYQFQRFVQGVAGGCSNYDGIADRCNKKTYEIDHALIH